MTAPRQPGPSIRWWSSARLRITAGITLTAAIVLAVVVLFAIQLMGLSADRATVSRLDREADDFSAFTAAGILPTTGEVSPSPEALLRAYLSQQYPEAELLLIGTAPGTGTQFTLSRYDASDDELFPPSTRTRLQEIGAESEDASGALDETVRWVRVVVDGPAGQSTLLAAVNDAGAEADARRVSDLLLITSAGGLVLTALIAWLLAGRMLEPVRRIREAAETISADDLSRRVPADGPDEIAALAHTVNAMLERVEDAYRTQREFLDDAGHELRTPLTVVQGNLDLIPDDPADRAEVTRIMQDELSRMTRIVEDLLTLARADRPDFLQLAPADVSELVLDVEAKVEVIADREWSVLPFADEVAVLDQHRITQALLQFCSNAVRFTSPGDRIEIGCTVVEPGDPTTPAGWVSGPPIAGPPGEISRRRLLWWVRDSGAGIPNGEEESIFERFHTARGQLRDGRGGTGLGLAIVATIARAHEGRAFAYNATGGGASFCLVVPLVTPTTPPSEEIESQPRTGRTQDAE